jgi:hypothetical protein
VPDESNPRHADFQTLQTPPCPNLGSPKRLIFLGAGRREVGGGWPRLEQGGCVLVVRRILLALPSSTRDLRFEELNESLALADPSPTKKRRSGIPTGNAGEYFVMGELLRRGYDAQLADRNTKGYDLLAGTADATTDMRRVQVKSVRGAPWYVNPRSFEGAAAEQVTVYVLLGAEVASEPVRYFIARNGDMTPHLHVPAGWTKAAFVPLAALEQYEVKAPRDWRRVLGE